MTDVEGSPIQIVYRTESAPINFAVQKLKAVLLELGESSSITNHSKNEIDQEKVSIQIYTEKNPPLSKNLLTFFKKIETEGFYILPEIEPKSNNIYILAKDETGAMYGTLELAEQLQLYKNVNSIKKNLLNPRFEFRAIKFNLPWSPYRSGPAMEIHWDVCRDLNFWQKFLDKMAENRFNVLSLWNLHPFTFMIRPENFPKACSLTDKELSDWQQFWKKLFRMAKNRGIETYIVNWNIVVSPEFAKAYECQEKNDTSEIVRRYTRECVTQVINEYDDLSGLGVTLADWMEDMTPKEREDWIEQTFVAGMKAAKRRIKFIHRSVLAGSPLEMRRVIDNADLPDPVWVEIKFNWSHGFSTPHLAITHDYNSGELDHRFWFPKPENYKIAWMIRNEDFFILRWGESHFIQEHIKMNGKDYVGGYFVGSEGYIPAMDFSHKQHSHKTWTYAFEKQWLFYKMWGRLLYFPNTPDQVFILDFQNRFPSVSASALWKAYQHASQLPLQIASFHAATWDYTLYSEGFLAPRKSRGLFDGKSAFISIDEFIQHETLDPNLMSIPEYVQKSMAVEDISLKQKTPLALAEASLINGQKVLEIVQNLQKETDNIIGELACELLDLKTWAYLSLYFSEKIHAAIALHTFRKTGNNAMQLKAIRHLEFAVGYWDRIINITEQHYLPFPHVSGEMFHWKNYREQVLYDIEIAKNAITQ